jgi:sortase (surface protein transpeptidase)
MTVFRSRRPREWAWWGATALALSIGVVALAGTLPQSAPAALVLSNVPVTPVQVVKVTPLFHNVPTSRPVRLTIPAIDVNTAVGTLGLQPDGQVMVPTSTHVVDWYKDGPTPGLTGSAVILGHVDSYKGPGTFFYLKELKSGDKIKVVLADGTVTHFVVTKVVEYAKSSFPDRLVYGSHGYRSLNLVTCGGVFNHDTGHYESNIVVFSRLKSVTLAKSGTST